MKSFNIVLLIFMTITPSLTTRAEDCVECRKMKVDDFANVEKFAKSTIDGRKFLGDLRERIDQYFEKKQSGKSPRITLEFLTASEFKCLQYSASKQNTNDAVTQVNLKFRKEKPVPEQTSSYFVIENQKKVKKYFEVVSNTINGSPSPTFFERHPSDPAFSKTAAPWVTNMVRLSKHEIVIEEAVFGEREMKYFADPSGADESRYKFGYEGYLKDYYLDAKLSSGDKYVTSYMLCSKTQ